MRERLTANAQQRQLAMQRSEEAELLRHQAFRRFLLRFAIRAGIYHSPYHRGDSHGTAFNAGRQSLGLEVLADLKTVEPRLMALIDEEGALLSEALARRNPRGAPDEDEAALPDDDDEPRG